MNAHLSTNASMALNTHVITKCKNDLRKINQCCILFIFSVLTLEIWTANSRVGERMSACGSRLEVSIDWSTPIENVAVLPVPDCAWAITSRPLIMGTIALCWIAEGFSNAMIESINWPCWVLCVFDSTYWMHRFHARGPHGAPWNQMWGSHLPPHCSQTPICHR